jgi:acetoin utilization protein AcuB
MFHVVGVDGIQRSFTPGSFRSRLEVQPVHKSQGISAATDTPTSSEEPAKHKHILERYTTHTTSNEPSEVLYAHQIMTSPVHAMPATTTIQEVAKVFTEHRYRHIPLVSPEGSLVGLISDRDILHYRVATPAREGRSDDEQVSKIMVARVLIATPDTPIREIARTMVEERIGSLPILDFRDNLVGIITRSDILRALITHGPMRLWA